jgi:hypothetical protein
MSRADLKDVFRSIAASLIVSLAVGAFSAYAALQVNEQRLGALEKEVDAVKKQAEGEREIVRQMASDVAWIRGRMEGFEK